MFKKMLIANRGEIAVRVMRTCREMGIATVALYEPADRNSLHVRMADECVLLSPGGFDHPQEIIDVGLACGADAVHPGYGFLAESAEFIMMCDQAGMKFIGPPAEVVDLVSNKVNALRLAEEAGFRVVVHSSRCFDELEYDALESEAGQIGYPIFVKSCRGGRGRGQHLVRSAKRLREMVVRAQWEARTIYHDRSIFLEKGYMPAHQINVQVLGDQFGRLAVFGEREGSLLYGNQKLFEESPSPALDQAQRDQLLTSAAELARLYHLQNAASIEFLLDETGQFYFVEVKPRIQMEHPLTEMTARIDLVKEQIRLAAGESLDEQLGYRDQHGCAIQCRIAAENPWRNFLPSPGEIETVRLPSGQDVRVDTYIQAGSEVPADYDPLIAKLVVWGPTRDACLRRARLAVDELKISGTPTNLPVIQNVLQAPPILQGRYNTDFRIRALAQGNGRDLPCETAPGQADGRGQTHLRDLAIAAAIYYVRRNQAASPSVPDRLRTGWHLKSRQLP